MKIDRPIFLLGNQGDGLTLLSRIIRRHERIVSISGDHRYWAGADEMQKVMLLRLPASLTLGGRFLGSDPPHGRLGPPRSWSYACDELLDWYRKTEADFDERAAVKLKQVIGEALCRFKKAGRSVRFMDKSQVFSVKMSYVNALLEGADPHFILVTRNPYAACYRAATGRAGDMRRYARHLSLDERMDICLQHWTNTMECIIEDSARVDHFHTLRFEDLLEDPATVVKRVCSFLDLPYSSGLIPHQSQRIPFGSRYRKRWYPIRKNVNEPYLRALPSRYLARIEERCGSLAERFGYHPPGEAEACEIADAGTGL